MPIDLVKILAVHPVKTANPAVLQHLIDAETIEEFPRQTQYVTINALRASLCKEKAGTDSLLWLTWRDGRFRTKEVCHVELREYVFARERNICRCCRKRPAESMHEIVFRSQRGKVSKKNSIAVCGDGVRGCHGFMQRHEIAVSVWDERAEGLLVFDPVSIAAQDWLCVKAGESIASPVMVEIEAE